MLYDLYMLSYYFSPEQAVMDEDEVFRRYDKNLIRIAMKSGLVRVYWLSERIKGNTSRYFQITPLGIKAIENAEI